MLNFLRTMIVAAFSALTFCPLLATNASTSAMADQADGTPPPRDIAALLNPDGEMLSRLRDIKSEIRHDLCRRTEQHYCLAGACLTLPLARQCAAPGAAPSDKS